MPVSTLSLPHKQVVANAWPIETPLSAQNSPVVVAIVDAGLDKNHDVFAKQQATVGPALFWINTVEANGLPGIDDDQNGFVDDING